MKEFRQHLVCEKMSGFDENPFADPVEVNPFKVKDVKLLKH